MATSDAIVAAPADTGIERIEARFAGKAFSPHRHDTYALGVTLSGVQTFHYRGVARFSMPGQVIVLHPDELHDGGAGTDAGLRYRMLYLEPARLRAAAGDGACGLSFVADPVVTDPRLAGALMAALGDLSHALDDLLLDEVIGAIADGLDRHGEKQARPIGRPAWQAVRIAAERLCEALDRPLGSAELEAVTGLDRYALARHFRTCLGTSPHRFRTMRRLERARSLIAGGTPIVDAAFAAGFADQSHLSRAFKQAYGLTPGRWAGLIAAADGASRG